MHFLVIVTLTLSLNFCNTFLMMTISFRDYNVNITPCNNDGFVQNVTVMVTIWFPDEGTTLKMS
jgi:hypothetical protein